MHIALLGYGTVGKGVDKICETLDAATIDYIYVRPGKVGDKRFCSDWSTIVSDTSIDTIVECMGGLEPAHTFIADALRAGKNVVSSNKAVIAAHYEEFVTLARKSGAALCIEASVGGGVPWIDALMRLKRIDKPECFSGIMNGTSNFILYTMSSEQKSFEEALAQAQELGYAEADPTADIDGIDIKNKTIISANIAFDISAETDIPTSGIRNITADDLAFFASRHETVKLVGRGVRKGSSYALEVVPQVMPFVGLEAQVPSNFNLLTVTGKTIGELKYYGQGAGQDPTAHAVVQDLLNCFENRVPKYRISKDAVYDPSLLQSTYIVRTTVASPQGAEVIDETYWSYTATAEQAAQMLRDLLAQDPKTFMAAK